MAGEPACPHGSTFPIRDVRLIESCLGATRHDMNGFVEPVLPEGKKIKLFLKSTLSLKKKIYLCKRPKFTFFLFIT